MKLSVISNLMLSFLILSSCVESKKEAEDSSVGPTGRKYFVSRQEIQVLNQIFVDQFSAISNELISANTTSVRVDNLMANVGGSNKTYQERGVLKVEDEQEVLANCVSFKSKYIDYVISGSGKSCQKNECVSDLHNMEDCSSNDLSVTCGESFTIRSMQTTSEIDYTRYQSDDQIIHRGWFYGVVDGGEFSNSEIDCAFSFTYIFGQTTEVNCENTSIRCTIDGNPASCAQVMDIGANGQTVNGCRRSRN